MSDNNKSSDALGDRMKMLEGGFLTPRLMPLLPVVARLDGKAFHTFTRGLARPYDQRLSDLMTLITKLLVEETNARIGYTQSDEITLVWQSQRYDSETYFGGRTTKILSVLAAFASVHFVRHLPDYLPEKQGVLPVFDCRVWNVPTRDEAVNALIWREQDATRNSVSMAAQSLYSPKQLHGQSCKQMQEMLFQKGINWNNYPAFFKRGTYVQRKKVTRAFTTDELEKLPPKHEARRNPNLVVDRRHVEAIGLPPLARVYNRQDVIFDGAYPILDKEEVTV